MYAAVHATEYNRVLMFKEPITDKVLPGDAIRSEKVADEGSCRVKCYLEPNCVSINVGPADVRGRTCELKNFTDKSLSHSALEERKDYIHYAVENFCQNSPCPGKNFLCQVGFTDKGYRCVCRDGYKGDQCNEDIDECKDESHNCGHPSNCENVPGSFHCVCKPDFINDGTKCEGNVCFNNPVGVADIRIILNTQMTSSTSRYNGHYMAYYGRLNDNRGDGWCTQSCCRSQDWLKVDLGKTFQICGVATQATRNYDEWVTDFNLSYSTNGNEWTKYKDRKDSEMEFHRSNESHTVDRHILPLPVLASYIRFHPTNQHKWNCLRVEVYGTSPCIRGTGLLSGYCYMLFKKPETWNNARDKCETAGAVLVKIGSAEENDFIKTTFLSSASTNYWIGLKDKNKDNKWEWTDGRLLSNGDYSNWRNQYPNNLGGNRYCVEILHINGKWNNWQCHHSNGFICKKAFL